MRETLHVNMSMEEQPVLTQKYKAHPGDVTALWYLYTPDHAHSCV